MRIKLINNDNIHTDISINPNIKLHELYALAIKREFIPYKQNGVCIMLSLIHISEPTRP